MRFKQFLAVLHETETPWNEKTIGLDFDNLQDLALARCFRAAILNHGKSLKDLIGLNQDAIHVRLAKEGSRFMKLILDNLIKNDKIQNKNIVQTDANTLSRIDKRELAAIQAGFRRTYAEFMNTGKFSDLTQEGITMQTFFNMHVETIKLLVNEGIGKSYMQEVINLYGKKPVFEAVGDFVFARKIHGMLAEDFLEPGKPFFESLED